MLFSIYVYVYFALQDTKLWTYDKLHIKLILQVSHFLWYHNHVNILIECCMLNYYTLCDTWHNWNKGTETNRFDITYLFHTHTE